MADCANKRVFTDMRSAKKAAKKQTGVAGMKIIPATSALNIT